MTFREGVLLAAGWLIWCSLHSLLITNTVSRWIQECLGNLHFYYRLLYNLTAFVTLLPLLAATAVLNGEIVFSWRGGWIGVQVALILLSLWLFHDGAKHYDIGYMLGLRQIRDHEQPVLLGKSGDFTREGSHGLTRHPWYLGALLFLWSILPVYHQSTVIAAAILSVYLVVGTWLEERKILAEFGEQYRSYQREVSMLIPWKWILNKVKGKR